MPGPKVRGRVRRRGSRSWRRSHLSIRGRRLTSSPRVGAPAGAASAADTTNRGGKPRAGEPIQDCPPMLSDSPRYEPPRLRSEPDPHDRSHAEQLWRAWSEHDDLAARNRLILSYVGMVKHLAHRKARELPAHYEVEDLVSAGLEALIAAVDRFDPAKGGFESYAWTRVSGALIDELRRADWAPRSLRRSARELEKAE